MRLIEVKATGEVIVMACPAVTMREEIDTREKTVELIILLVVVALIVIVLLVGFGIYNGLVSARQRVEEAWSGIDVQLKRRASLVPNLVETVKGYASHEREVLENVTRARSQVMGAQDAHEAAEADNMLSQTLKSLFAVSEAYPDLKANTNFQSLQNELSDLEAKIAYARQFYNTNVRSLNTKIQTLPAVLVARQLGFREADYFETDEEARADVNVSFR
ncbi:MAG: LemA family protein [Dehalococcoidia bacterium]